MLTPGDWKQMFKDLVRSYHVKFSHDAGHAYSYIEHPVMGLLDEFDGEVEDELNIWANEWLYENEDDMPPCGIHVDYNTETVRSMCGCHDRLDFHKDKEEIESIITELQQWHDDNP